MKKIILSSLVLLLAMVAQAQVKVAPKLEKGFKAVYQEESSLNVAGTDMTVVTETTYSVTDVTADGAVIEVVQKTISGLDGDDPASKLMKLTQDILTGKTFKIATDGDGKMLKIINIDDIKANAKDAAEKAMKQLIKSTPALDQMSQEAQEAIVEEVLGRLSEDALMDGFEVLSLNGKTIASGAQEEYTKEGMKMKRMYFVTGKNIIANSTLNMSKDELKQFIIDQVTADMPEQAEMIKQNIDMIMSSAKFDLSEKTTYELQDNGWVKSIKTDSKREMMGQKSSSTSVVTLK